MHYFTLNSSEESDSGDLTHSQDISHIKGWQNKLNGAVGHLNEHFSLWQVTSTARRLSGTKGVAVFCLRNGGTSLWKREGRLLWTGDIPSCVQKHWGKDLKFKRTTDFIRTFWYWTDAAPGAFLPRLSIPVSAASWLELLELFPG